MKGRIPRNFVAIKPAPAFTSVAGMQIVDEDSLHQPNFGEVVIVPDTLVCTNLPLKDPKKGQLRAKERQLERQGSIGVGSKMNLKVGDIVYYKYIYNVSDDDDFQDVILVPYDDIYCVINGEDIKMLNDYCLIRPDELVEVGELHQYRKFKQGVGTLVQRCEGDITYADFDHPTTAPPVGSTVYYKFLRAPRMEASLHQKLNKEGRHSLLKVRAKDIGFFFIK